MNKSARIKVQEHGFVQLIDTMGDDHEPARAARGEYDEEREWGELRADGTFPPETDGRTTTFMNSHLHTTPFEMVEVKFLARMPIFVARQWVRHRTANINEMSLRYDDAEEAGAFDYYTPPEWRGKPPRGANRQGSAVDAFTPEEQKGFTADYQAWVNQGLRLYRDFSNAGVANEHSRLFIPVGGYTKWVWKNDLKNTIHFLMLRADSHAQSEIRDYAVPMLDLLKERFPKLMDIVWPPPMAKLL